MGLSPLFIAAFALSAAASSLILLRAAWNLRSRLRDKLAVQPN